MFLSVQRDRRGTYGLAAIEIEWREIKAAIADTFFGGLDKMRDAIIRMLYNKEIPIVRLFDWLLPPEYAPRRSADTPRHRTPADTP